MTEIEFKRKKSYGLISNKEMIINDIIGVHIDHFRLFKNQYFKLGKYITVVSGRNGTMKSTLMGLVAQPYNSEYRDVFGKRMQTKFSDVFKLSSKKDQKDYLYHIQLDINDNLLLQEPVPLYFQEGNPDTKTSTQDRHRLVPSGREKGDGYFNLPSVYINLKRLYPLIESGEIIEDKNLNYSEKEKKFIGDFYQKVLLKSDFDAFNKYSAKGVNSKNPYGPSEESYYDVQSISSGEDNLSTFIDVLISFMRVYDSKKENNVPGMTGVFSIDEFEASLHPIAQANLFCFLLQWSKKYNVKILLNTHSLFLIQYIYLNNSNDIDNENVILNFIESDGEKNLTIIKNPDYKLAYRELTLSNMEEKKEFIKVKTLCEDSVAKTLISKMLKHRIITSNIIISHTVNDNNDGTSFKLLTQLCRNFPAILQETKSIVVVDADVDIKNETTYNHLLKIPSLFNYAFEKEIVRYILELDPNHKLFTETNETKEMFKQSFIEHGINLNVNTYDSDKNTKPFKNWYGSINNVKRNRLIKHYIQDNKLMVDTFREEFLDHLNCLRIQNGFTPINLWLLMAKRRLFLYN